MENEKKLEDVLKEIDDIELIPKEKLAEMDFYELSYYMQVLNTIDSLSELKQEEDK